MGNFSGFLFLLFVTSFLGFVLYLSVYQLYKQTFELKKLFKKIKTYTVPWTLLQKWWAYEKGNAQIQGKFYDRDRLPQKWSKAFVIPKTKLKKKKQLIMWKFSQWSGLNFNMHNIFGLAFVSRTLESTGKGKRNLYPKLRSKKDITL